MRIFFLLIFSLLEILAGYAQSQALKSAIISLIDDDTLNPGGVETFHQVCVDNGIVGTLACITSRNIYFPNLFTILHGYEDEGFQITLHCHEQRNFYRWSQNLDATVQGVEKVSVGANYSYTVGKRVCPLSVEEVHLDKEGNGHIFFNYMQKHYPVPSTLSGYFTLSSGNGDQTIAYSNFEVREFRDSEKVRADMETAIGILGNEDFKDCTYFVSPYGSQDEGLQEIAKEHGLKCLVSISNDDYLRNDSKYTPYNIPRIGFNATDGGNNTLSRLKEHIDAVSVSGGWLLVGTHTYNGWTEELLNTRFKEFVDYAKEKGLQFVTLKKGFELYSNSSGNENFPPVPSAVEELEQSDAEEINTGVCYNILGRRLEKPQHGLNIIRLRDGMTKKIWIE